MESSFDKWQSGVSSEFSFWSNAFKSKGAHNPKEFADRVSDNYLFQDYLVQYLPDKKDILILDVGSGPITSLGRILEGKNLKIHAVDPLADMYNSLLKEFDYISLSVPKTEKVFGEALSHVFDENFFDFIHSRNALDHSFDPERCLDEMFYVLKPGCFIYLEHRVNVAILEKYSGLHQWNFRLLEGDFMINEINISKKFLNRGVIKNEISEDIWSEIIKTTIQKL